MAGLRRDRRVGGFALVAGFLVALAAQLAGPIAVPLYDGVVVTEPYRYLAPTAGQAGSPTSYDQTFAVTGGTSPTLPAATTESPPQAQLIVPPGGVTVSASTTAIRATVQPIAPGSGEASPQVAGNIYRIAITDQAGVALAPAGGLEWTVVLRAPAGIVNASVGQFVDGQWRALETQDGSQPGIFLANTATLGDFAILPSSGLLGLTPGIVGFGLVFAGGAIAFVVSWRFRNGAGRRRARSPGPNGRKAAKPVPSEQRRRRRSGGNRSGRPG